MKPGTLDVVVPAHNAGRFLGTTLQSVALQHVLPRSVIVVDDRSTDDTAAVAVACAADYADFLPIRLLHNTGPRGPSAARNLAIRHSDAEFIVLLDADDLLAPAHHQLLLSAMQSAPDIVVAFGDSTEFNAHGEIVRSQFAKSGVGTRPVKPLAHGIFTLADGMFTALLGAGAFGTSACIIRRHVALDAGLFDETLRFGEDTDLFLRLALAGRFAFTRAKVMHKREHDANLTHARNTPEFDRAKVLSLTHLSAQAETLPLSVAERDALQAELVRAIDAYTYHASRRGPAGYGDALRLARDAGQPAIAFKPRHLARMVLRGIGTPDRVA
ncbi:MAG: glycosyltransferase family A protein [Stellaceae bacterium]